MHELGRLQFSPFSCFGSMVSESHIGYDSISSGKQFQVFCIPADSIMLPGTVENLV